MTTDREMFERHASPEAIQARLDQAYTAQQAAGTEIKWLTGLLIARATQVRLGLWPPRETP